MVSHLQFLNMFLTQHFEDVRNQNADKKRKQMFDQMLGSLIRTHSLNLIIIDHLK